MDWTEAVDPRRHRSENKQLPRVPYEDVFDSKPGQMLV
eukprot:CAMPEP_0203843926 /NCGR_PEP_ID=MMETSP0359-20131031/2880_1 /ASSEMBLY_ACC=CAM_ASM_000338 /TAXON_ID=268821 /ORGANISM="Scrippsiella Hangoei, Strain SHTV-5" /LENGTH=37 /DNA_ID= /DNA_START= /DNA_END= /DNA_ORIENTATION=